MKRVLFVLFLALVVGAVAYGLWRNPGEEVLSVYAARAEKKTFVRELTADGEVRSARLRLGFERPGRVVTVAAEEGERVAAGDLIARIEDEEERTRLRLVLKELEAHRARAELELSELEGRRKELLTKLAEAERELELAAALHRVGAASRREVEEKRRALAEARRALAELEQRLAATRARLERERAELEARKREAERALAKTELRAPEDALVLSLPFVPGAPARGEAELAPLATLRPEARFPEADAAEIRVGQPAWLELTARPDAPLKTEVAALLPPEEEGGAVWVPVRFASPEAELVPGLTFTARVEVERIEDALVVPLEALVEEEDGVYVWVVEEGRAKRRRVEKLAQNLTEAAISGLAPGTIVLRLAPEELEEGARVRPVLEGEGAGGT